MVVSNLSQHGSGFVENPGIRTLFWGRALSPDGYSTFFIFYCLMNFFNIYGNSDCRSLVFTEMFLKTLADGLRVHILRSREVSYQNVLMQLSCENDYQLRREGLTTSSAKRQVKRRSTSSQQFFKTITSQLLIKFINLLWFTSQSNLYKLIFFILWVILIWTATNVRVLKPDAALNMPIY